LLYLRTDCPCSDSLNTPGNAERGVVIELPAFFPPPLTEPDEHEVRQAETSTRGYDISEKAAGERRREFQSDGGLDSRQVEKRPQCESEDAVGEGSYRMCVDGDEGKTYGPRFALNPVRRFF